ncbi:hypothetical protein YC2023_118085 [Brassica napus]
MRKHVSFAIGELCQKFNFLKKTSWEVFRWKTPEKSSQLSAEVFSTVGGSLFTIGGSFFNVDGSLRIRFSGKFKFTIRQEDIPKSLTVHYLLENLSNINPKIKKLSKHKQTLY